MFFAMAVTVGMRRPAHRTVGDSVRTNVQAGPRTGQTDLWTAD